MRTLDGQLRRLRRCFDHVNAIDNTDSGLAEYTGIVVVDAPSEVSDVGLGVDGVLVLAALAAVMIGQGGYYRRVNDACAVLLAVAGAVLLWRRVFTTLRLRVPALAGLGVMASCTVVVGVLDRDVRGALGPVALLAGLAVIVAVVAASTVAARRQIADVTLALGVLLSTTGWVGVAFHVRPIGHPDAGLWRAATTVTYANAAAAILAMLALWALARATVCHRWPGRVAAVLLLAGLGATLSRAGLASFAAGLVILTVLLGFGLVCRAIGMVLLGGFVAAAALAPGMPEASGGRPLWALLGLAAGLVIGVVRWPEVLDRRRAPVRRSRRRWIGWFALLTGLAIGVALVGLSAHTDVWSGRLGLSSPDRTSLASVALHMWFRHPFRGVGPGRAVFLWTTAHHQLLFDRYAHNEYLQLAVEQGVIGLVAVVALGAAIGGTVFAGWRSDSRSQTEHVPDVRLRSLRAGAIAGLICLSLHSAFDFLWHVPAVPMIAAVAVGLAARELGTEVSQPPTQEIP